MSSHVEEKDNDEETICPSSDQNHQTKGTLSMVAPSVEGIYDEVKSLKEKLSAALLDANAKDDLVQQHAKVAEEAIAGWKKADNEAAELKQRLETAIQHNSTLEKRITHLDGALKECVRQLRQSREEQEQTIREAVLKNIKDWESTKYELEAQILHLHTQLDASKDAPSIDSNIYHKLDYLKEENSALKKNDEVVKGGEQVSPVLGLLSESETTKKLPSEEKEVAVLNEETIKKAINKRAAHFVSNSETITMAGVRRLLEEDLKLEKYALDAYKKFISQRLDDVLNAPQAPKSAAKLKNDSKKKAIIPSKTSRKDDSEELGSHSAERASEGLDDEMEKVKPRKRVASREKSQNSAGAKKQKINVKKTKSATKKRQPTDSLSEDHSDAEDDGNAAGDGHSQSSTEKIVKRKEVSTPMYGKRVEHLKSVIKSCAMSISPAIYKRVKQAPEHKREAFLIKELEAILSKEGLSSNPSEKEIKEVRERKQREKELEGIDMSNIVSSSRRRSTTSFVPPPKPKIPVESEDGDDDENGDDDDSNSDEENHDGGDNKEGNEDSQSNGLDQGKE